MVLLAIAVNRGAFFSSELMATAEAAVLFTLEEIIGDMNAPLLGSTVVASVAAPSVSLCVPESEAPASPVVVTCSITTAETLLPKFESPAYAA